MNHVIIFSAVTSMWGFRVSDEYRIIFYSLEIPSLKVGRFRDDTKLLNFLVVSETFCH